MGKIETVNENKIPKDIKLIISDINGTITSADKVDEEILDHFLEIAKSGRYIIFITGRDRIWLEKSLIETIETKDPDKEVMERLRFYSELGLCEWDLASRAPMVYPAVLDHSIMADESLQKKISGLFLKISDLEIIKDDEKSRRGYYPVRDANKVRYWYPMRIQALNPNVIFYDFILSDTKEIIITAEVIRNDRSGIPENRSSQIPLAADSLESLFSYWKIAEKVKIAQTTTAIDITPVINGIAADKSWAAGRALGKIAEQTGEDIRELALKSIAIGDGQSDFKFSHPLNLNNLNEEFKMSFVFVGRKLPKIEQKEQDMLIIQSAPIPGQQERYSGVEVTKEALKILGLWEL